VLDTGCGTHPWLPSTIVTTYPTFDGKVIGMSDRASDPEVTGDVAGPLDGALDPAAGHGTFVSGIVRQRAPEADIISVRVCDSQGQMLEAEFMYAVRTLVKWMSTRGGRQIDVINLSLGYYHETPEDDLYDDTLGQLLTAARRRGCAVVCSAGNDATNRPAFPAALWRWRGAPLTVDDPRKAAPHISVGALNPNRTMALFSNLGHWVKTFAPGCGVLSSSPPFRGGCQPAVRDDLGGVRRETIDPDDYSGGFAVWSGTSFAAPYVTGEIVAQIAPALMAGRVTVEERVELLRKAERTVLRRLAERGPLPG
jgi:subtilisin family serine protease